MSGALKADWSTGRLFSPETVDPAGTILMKYGALLNQREDEKAARAAKEAQLAESKRQFDTTVGFKEREEKRAIDELNRTQNKDLAQNEALKAVLNPSAYSADKVRNERAAMEQSIAGLSPREQDSIRSQYDPTASGKGWVDSATGSSLVDQVKLMSAKDADYKIKASTPGTPEYEAIKKAEWDEYTKKQNYASGLQAAADRRREAKEEKQVNALLKGLTTGTTGTKETVTDNIVDVNATNKYNKGLEDKAVKYGEVLEKKLTNNKDVDRLDSIIGGIEKDIETEQVRGDIVGGQASPKVAELNARLGHYRKMKDDLFGRLDTQAKEEVGLDELYQSKFLKPVEYKETKNTEDVRLSKEDWLKAALPNAKGAGIAGINAVISQGEKLYPTVDKKEAAKIAIEKETAEDLKKIIQRETGKPAVSSTKEGLEKEVTRIKDKDMDSTSAINKAILGVRTDEGWLKVNNERIDAQEAAKEAKVKNPKLSDSKIAEAITYATNESKDFNVGMFKDYLGLE